MMVGGAIVMVRRDCDGGRKLLPFRVHRLSRRALGGI